MKITAGSHRQLGAVYDGRGVNFALFSENATAVELCLYDSADPRTETRRIPLKNRTEFIWHCYIYGLRPGQVYAYRVYGPYHPESGNRFNSAKIMMDPYAKVLARPHRMNQSLFLHDPESKMLDLDIDLSDNIRSAPLAAVPDLSFDWEGVQPPHHPWRNTVIYETHVKGITMKHPDVPEHLRGTYAGLAHPAVTSYLQDLGVTAVELLPVHYHADEGHLIASGLSNYWGYNTLSFFIPEPGYAADRSPEGMIREFKGMVKALHRAGIEVILDVVYNHTAEGNGLGPAFSFRGIDNKVYYRLHSENQRFYINYTGCGNTLNTQNPVVLRMILDSLRYWVTEYHIDGFRFDLAVTLGRGRKYFDRLGSFFNIIMQDPVLSGVKLIAEPWDIGDEGYQPGSFPVPWAEWNDHYRDTMRRFWKGDTGMTAQFATRFSGSSDLFGISGRGPYSSINYITSHDGFTLRDLVSYNAKHNLANREENRDGHDNNESWNCGEEGETENPDIRYLRLRQKRNMIATLLLSQGTPMILGGDETGRTQNGNNNAYCQDNDLSWYDWTWDTEKSALHQFFKDVISLRLSNGVFRRTRFLEGTPDPVSGNPDISWIHPKGHEMTQREWFSEKEQSIGIVLYSESCNEEYADGTPVPAKTVLILINSGPHVCNFRVPHVRKGKPRKAAQIMSWKRIFDTRLNGFDTERYIKTINEIYVLQERSVALFEAEDEYEHR